MPDNIDIIDELWDLPKLKTELGGVKGLLDNYLQTITETAKKGREQFQLMVTPDGLAQLKTFSAEADKLTKEQVKNLETLAKARLADARAEESRSRTALNALKLKAVEEKKELDLQKQLEAAAKKNTKALVDHEKALRKHYAGIGKAYEKQQKEKIRLEKEDAKFQRELEAASRANTKALLDHDKAVKKADADLAKLNNEYEQAKVKNNALAKEAMRLGFALGVESKEFKEAAAAAHAMHSKLLLVESSVGRTHRQVGNYNMVGAQFNQLLREAPNFAISMRTGIMALTNNVTYFGESIKAARKEGQSYRTIMKSMGRSMFGLVGILNLAVLAITYFSLKANDASSATNKAEEATKRYTDAINDAGKAASRNAAEEKTRLDTLNSVATDVTKSTKARNKAVEEMIKLYPKYLEGYTQEAIKAGKAAAAIDLITEAIVSRAKAQAAESRVLASESKIYDLEQARKQAQAREIKQYKNISEAKARNLEQDEDGARLIDVYIAKRELETASVKELTKQIDEARAMQEQYAKEAADATGKAFGFDDFGSSGSNSGSSKGTKKDKDRLSFLPSVASIEQQIKELENAGLANRLNQALFVSEQDEKSALIALENQYKQGLITGEQYEADKLKIQNDYAIQRVKLEIDTNKKLLANGGQMEDERAATISQLNDLELQLAEDGNKAKLKAEEDYSKASVKIEQERAKLIQGIRQQVTAAVIQFADFAVSREQDNLNTKKQRLDDEKAYQLAFIDATSDSEERAAQRRFVLEQDILQQKRVIQKREEDLEKRKFAIEQAAALARVFVSAQEATAKVQANAAVLSSTVATAPLAAAALAQIPLIQASAAIQAGLIAAQVVAYGDGTPLGGHKGGDALIGERYEPEYVTEPSGKSYWVSTPTYMPNMPKGTDVTPISKMTATDLDRAQVSNANAIMLMGGGNSARTEALLNDAVSELRNIKNKPVESLTIKNGSMFKTIQKGNNKIESLDNDFLN